MWIWIRLWPEKEREKGASEVRHAKSEWVLFCRNRLRHLYTFRKNPTCPTNNKKRRRAVDRRIHVLNFWLELMQKLAIWRKWRTWSPFQCSVFSFQYQLFVISTNLTPSDQMLERADLYAESYRITYHVHTHIHKHNLSSSQLLHIPSSSRSNSSGAYDVNLLWALIVINCARSKYTVGLADLLLCD